MAEVGIMGGTFDPIHQAHLIIAEQAFSELGLDKVMFMPGGNPPHKSQKKVTDKKIRCEMVERAISGNPHFELCTYELERERYSYTAETMQYLKNKYANDNFYLIIGEDSLAYFDEWYKPEVIADLCTLAVYRRGADSDVIREAERINRLFKADIRLIEAPVIDISSTLIRENIKKGKTVKYFLPDSVIKIIEREGLYVQQHYDRTNKEKT